MRRIFFIVIFLLLTISAAFGQEGVGLKSYERCTNEGASWTVVKDGVTLNISCKDGYLQINWAVLPCKPNDKPKHTDTSGASIDWVCVCGSLQMAKCELKGALCTDNETTNTLVRSWVPYILNNEKGTTPPFRCEAEIKQQDIISWTAGLSPKNTCPEKSPSPVAISSPASFGSPAPEESPTAEETPRAALLTDTLRASYNSESNPFTEQEMSAPLPVNMQCVETGHYAYTLRNLNVITNPNGYQRVNEDSMTLIEMEDMWKEQKCADGKLEMMVPSDASITVTKYINGVIVDVSHPTLEELKKLFPHAF